MGQEPESKGFDLKPATAIGYSIATNLGGDRQLTAQCFVGEDEPAEVINAKMDKVFAIVDRQKARYDLQKLEVEFEEVARHLRNFLNAIPMADQASKHQDAVLKVKLAEQQSARDEVYKQGYADAVAAGRRGAFEPKGALLSRLNGMDAEIRKTQAAIDGLPNDTEQHRSLAIGNVHKYQDDLKKRRVAINDLRKLAGLDEYTLFMDEEQAKIE